VRRLSLLVPLALALAALTAPAAHAGGFATAGLSSMPTGVRPGQPWKVELTVLQHGRTPMAGLEPRIVIRSGDTRREFAAVPAGKPGVYRAEVVFPSAGRWDYRVLDSFNDGMPHTFPAVRIGDGAAATPAAAKPAPDDGGVATGWLWGAGAALVLALALLAGDRLRRRPATAPRGAEPA
jgi:hypothetical protein